MDSKLVGLICGLIGTGVGSLVTYLYVSKRADARLEKEIADFKAYYVDEVVQIEKQTEDEPEIDSKAPSEPVETPIPDSVLDSAARMRAVIRESNGSKKDRTNYNDICGKEGYSDMSDVKAGPYIVDAEDFFNPMGNAADYEKIECYYDTENGEIYSEDGNYEFDTDEAVGYSNLHGFEDDGLTTVFVQNDKMRTLFKIMSDDPRM